MEGEEPQHELETRVFELQSLDSPDSQRELAIALHELAGLYQSKGLVLKCNKARSLAVAVYLRCLHTPFLPQPETFAPQNSWVFKCLDDLINSEPKNNAEEGSSKCEMEDESNCSDDTTSHAWECPKWLSQDSALRALVFTTASCFLLKKLGLLPVQINIQKLNVMPIKQVQVPIKKVQILPFENLGFMQKTETSDPNKGSTT